MDVSGLIKEHGWLGGTMIIVMTVLLVRGRAIYNFFVNSVQMEVQLKSAMELIAELRKEVDKLKQDRRDAYALIDELKDLKRQLEADLLISKERLNFVKHGKSRGSIN